METQFLHIDPNNKEEQLYYPELDFTVNPEISEPQEDLYFVDLTSKSEKEDANYKIIRTDINTFKLKNSFHKVLVIALIVFGFVFALAPLISEHFSLESIGKGIICILFFFVISILIDRQDYYIVNLILEPNSIVLKKKSIFRRNTFIYNFGELERLALYYKYFSQARAHHQYILYFVKKNGKKDIFKEMGRRSMDYDFKGIKYFIDLINAHINKNMK